MPEASPRRDNGLMDDWLTPDVAAAVLGVTRTNLHVIAHRDRWHRIRPTTRETAYRATDVYATAEHRAQQRSRRANPLLDKDVSH